MATPFMKWAGGKRQLLPDLLRMMPARFWPEQGRYFEPFLGGGAFFFALRSRGLVGGATLSDLNEELINAYRVVAVSPGKLLDALRRHENDRDHFYGVRAAGPPVDPVERAARTIFLNRTCFNGLYRVNKKGRFNVPFGNYKRREWFDPEVICLCSLALRRSVTIRAGDFAGAIRGRERAPRAGDFVYLDPPYLKNKKGSFTSYQPGGFDLEDHERLACWFEQLSSEGVSVLESNADLPWVRERYSSFRIEPVSARRSINSNGRGRGPVGEVLISNYEIARS